MVKQGCANSYSKAMRLASGWKLSGKRGLLLDDMVIYLKASFMILAYLQQNAFDKEDAYCPLKRQIPLFQLINRIFDSHFNFIRMMKREIFLRLAKRDQKYEFYAF